MNILPNKFMAHTLSSEDDRQRVCQEIIRLYGTYPELVEPSPHPHGLFFLGSLFIFSSHPAQIPN
jgi:hypothetical protein